MKTVVVAMLAVAGSAAADIDRSGYTIYSATGSAIDGGVVSERGIAGPVYSNQTSDVAGFFSIGSGPADGDGDVQVINFDDYTSIAPGGGFLDEFGFIGGVDVDGGVVFFDIFDTGGVFVDGFGVSLASAGNFIYTINITNNDVAFPESGIVQMSVDDDGAFGPAANGTWFLTADAATIGDNGAGAGFTGPGGEDLHHTFELVAIPAPASAMLLGLGGLAAVRRRR
ncbi:MAG: VPLPA-CTERM sorting domain-containing protein [Planctomycetota bacterium]